MIAIANQRQGGGQHADAALGHGTAAGELFVADIHHMGLAASIEMG
jgi:hypothetical protein